jgi:hypothetical protein
MGGMEGELHGILFRLYAEASSGHHSTAAVIPEKTSFAQWVGGWVDLKSGMQWRP